MLYEVITHPRGDRATRERLHVRSVEIETVDAEFRSARADCAVRLKSYNFV